jgi:hypothetical protein
MTTQKVAEANAIQEFICSTTQFVTSFLGQTGGNLPILNYVADKCDFPEDIA